MRLAAPCRLTAQLIALFATIASAAELAVEKVPYLGRERMFGVGIDDPNPYVHRGRDNLQVYLDYLLGDLMPFSESARFTNLVVPYPDVVPPFEDWTPMDGVERQISWLYQDLEYERRNTVQLHGLTHQWSWECGHEFGPLCPDSPHYPHSFEQVRDAVRRSVAIYESAIGRQPLVWKFPGYQAGRYGVAALDSVFPVVVYAHNRGGDTPSISGRRVHLRDHMPNWVLIPTEFSGNYFVAAHGTLVWSAAYDSMADCSNFIWCDRYRSRLLTLMDYAEWQAGDVLHVDYSEVGEITDTFANTQVLPDGPDGFLLVDRTTYPYRKRLGVKFAAGFSWERQFLRVTTPSGMKVAQGMIRYEDQGPGRHATVVIPAEEGRYRVEFLASPPVDPTMCAEPIAVRPAAGPTEPAWMDYALAWEGEPNVWGEYASGTAFVHGFRFSDERWVEKDFLTGSLHLLGPSGLGREEFTSRLPFAFYRSVEDPCYRRYILDASRMRLSIPALRIVLPEAYGEDWELRIADFDGVTRRLALQEVADGVAFQLQIRERGMAVLEYASASECFSVIPDETRAAPLRIYPNPASGARTISFEMPEAGRVWIDIVSVDGRRVRSLLDGETRGPGLQTILWSPHNDRGEGVAEGVTYLVLRGPQGTTRRCAVTVR